jgi:hypothetical protein
MREEETQTIIAEYEMTEHENRSGEEVSLSTEEAHSGRISIGWG